MTNDLPPQAYAAALAAFAHMTVHRLGALLRHRTPQEAFAMATGQARPNGLIARVLTDAAVARAWCAPKQSPAEIWQRCADLGVATTYLGADDYPTILVDDRLPPPVLFVRGDLSLLDGRRVAVVGTRNSTAAGADIAGRLGSDLAEAGVHVVSGLARGIDGRAHRGVVSSLRAGRPIAVVASGHDVVYPGEHRALWQQVGEVGLLVTEAAPGTAPEAYRFPLRNRIIAALSELVVVVESRERGGSLITVTEATERGIPVMAVPGSPHNRAAAGTNNLLREGAGVVIDVSDVLVALSMDHRRCPSTISDQRARPSRTDRSLYDVCAAEPRTIEGVALAAGIDLVTAAMGLARLQQSGWISDADGWFEVIGSPLR